MRSYPNKMVLHYALHPAFLEHEALEGRFPEREQSVTYDVADLPPDEHDRLIGVWSQLAWVGRRRWPIVHGTGIDDSTVGDEQLDLETMDRPIRAAIGPLPTLLSPPRTATDLIEAYERWIQRYRELSREALQAWALRFARDAKLTTADRRHGISTDYWVIPIQIHGLLDSKDAVVPIDARDGSAAFQRARAAFAGRDVTARLVGSDSWQKAVDIVGTAVNVEDVQNVSSESVLRGYESVTERLIAVALAHHHAGADDDRRFAADMSWWASTKGSERLRLGVEDGYRMTSIYLDERLADEAPTFYAFRPEQPGLVGKERSGPTEKALKLCRAVQRRLDEAPVRQDAARYRAVIRWVTSDDVPKSLVDPRETSDRDGVEALVIDGWLGRYQLIGVVLSDQPESPPRWPTRYIDPSAYGLESDSAPGLFSGSPF